MNHLFATVKALANEGNGTFEAVASRAILDRDGEIVDAKAFDPLPEFVPIHVDHNMTSAGLVGTGRPYYDGGVLKVVGEFAGTARAQEVRQLVNEGHLSSMSIGFLAGARKMVDGVPHVTKGELLEISFVTVPALREARVLTSRGYGQRSAADNELRNRVTLQYSRAVAMLAEIELAELARGKGRPSGLEATHRLVAEAQALLRRLNGR